MPCLDSLSTLVLDDTFDASSYEAQQYLLEFCGRLFDSDLELAQPLTPETLCPINEFDVWLREESKSPSPSLAYITYCNEASSVPMQTDDFDSCIIAWSTLNENKSVLGKRGEVKILRLLFKIDIHWDAPFTEMDTFWKKN